MGNRTPSAPWRAPPWTLRDDRHKRIWGTLGGMSAEDVGRLARRLTTGLYVHAATLELVRDPRVRDLTPTGNPVGHPPAGLVQRKDGTLSAYDWLHHLNVAMDDPDMATELDRAWVVSALVVLGDRLAAEDYFDRAPLLEMVGSAQSLVDT